MTTDELFAPLAGVPIDDLDLYVVGGAVRDTLLGRKPHDVDYVAVGTTERVLRDRGFQPVGADFPVFLHPVSHVEVALARTERKVRAGHTGFTVHADPSVRLEDDLLRRDFTVNAMALSRTGKLIDPYGGHQDLSGRVLRHVSDAFKEDPLRVLRGLRFLSQLAEYGFTLADTTQTLMTSMAERLTELSPERVVAEMDRTLLASDPLAGLRWLAPLGIASVLAPALHQIPQSFKAQTVEGRWIEWALCNPATEACIQTMTTRYKTSAFRRQALLAALRVSSVQTLDADTMLATMQHLGWLRGNEPDADLDATLTDADQAGLFPIPIARWLNARTRVREITAAHPAVAGLSGAALGEAIYSERLRVLCTEISAPGTAPGL